MIGVSGGGDTSDDDEELDIKFSSNNSGANVNFVESLRCDTGGRGLSVVKA